MSKKFVIRNQSQHYLSQDKTWVDGTDPTSLFRSSHKDIAVNELFEANVRDFALRAELIHCETSSKGYPSVEVLNPIPILAEENLETFAEPA